MRFGSVGVPIPSRSRASLSLSPKAESPQHPVWGLSVLPTKGRQELTTKGTDDANPPAPTCDQCSEPPARTGFLMGPDSLRVLCLNCAHPYGGERLATSAVWELMRRCEMRFARAAGDRESIRPAVAGPLGNEKSAISFGLP